MQRGIVGDYGTSGLVVLEKGAENGERCSITSLPQSDPKTFPALTSSILDNRPQRQNHHDQRVQTCGLPMVEEDDEQEPKGRQWITQPFTILQTNSLAWYQLLHLQSMTTSLQTPDQGMTRSCTLQTFQANFALAKVALPLETLYPRIKLLKFNDILLEGCASLFDTVSDHLVQFSRCTPQF